MEKAHTLFVGFVFIPEIVETLANSPSSATKSFWLNNLQGFRYLVLSFIESILQNVGCTFREQNCMQKSQLHNILEKNSGRYIFWKLCSLFGVLFFSSNFDGVFLGGRFCQEKGAVLFGIGVLQRFT